MPGLASLPKRVDVAIVGGGPGGLSMAKAISRARPGTTIKVLESAPCYVPQGAGVTVDINGWRALSAIDPTLYDRLRPRGFLFQGGAFRDKVGNEVPSPFAGKSTVDHEGNVAKHGTTLVTFPWHEVREGLHDSLEPGTVTFGAAVVSSTVGSLAEGQPSKLIIAPSASRGGGGTDGQLGEQQHEMEAGLVIAADGYFSGIRRQAFGSNDLKDVGKVIWRALLTFDGEAAVPEVLQGLKFGWAISWMDNTPEGLPLRNAMVYPVTPTSFVWTALAPTSDLHGAGASAVHSGGRRGEQAKANVLAVLRGWDPAFVQLVTMSHPSTVTEHGYYTHDVSALAQGCWVRGNVAVTGDAAHSGPPDGQGMNLAFEDAAVMGAMLQRHGLTAKALEEWEAARIPRVQAIFGEKTYVKPLRDQAVWSSSFEPLGVPTTAVA